MSSNARFKIVQISDTHLSATHAYFHENWTVLLESLSGETVDLIVHSGDVSFNGAKNEADIAYARAQFDHLPQRWLAISGNHDIGEAPRHSRLSQPINDERLCRWQRHFGCNWWMEDIGAWRFIGIDTALMGSERPEESEQLSFLTEALESRGVREAMVFTHMPPFVLDVADKEFTTSAIPFVARMPFLDLCRKSGVKVIASGHLHIYHQTQYEGIDIIWAPTTAMVSIEKQLKRLNRVPRPGYIVWSFDGRNVEHAFVNPEMMFMLDVTSYTKRNGGSTTKLPPKPLVVRSRL